jgi:hypothetical protein
MRTFSCYFIDKLPDLTMTKYQALPENDVGGLLELEKSLSSLVGVDIRPLRADPAPFYNM